MSLWSFLRGLWPWRKRPQPEPQASVPEASVPEASPPLAAPEPAPPTEAPPPADVPAAEAPAVEAPEPVAEPAEAAAEAAEAPDDQAPVDAAPTEETPVEAAPADEAPLEEPLDEEEDEDGGWEDEEVEDPDAPDPFISGALEAEADDVDLAERRAAARATALSGEQRIYLSMPAGPGSLAEALEQLAAEGLVKSEFVSEGEDGPHLLYRPLAAPSAAPAGAADEDGPAEA